MAAIAAIPNLDPERKSMDTFDWLALCTAVCSALMKYVEMSNPTLYLFPYYTPFPP